MTRGGALPRSSSSDSSPWALIIPRKPGQCTGYGVHLSAFIVQTLACSPLPSKLKRKLLLYDSRSGIFCLYSRKESDLGRRKWSHIPIRRRLRHRFLTKRSPKPLPEPSMSPIPSISITVVWDPESALLQRRIPCTWVHCSILAYRHPPRPQSYQCGYLATPCSIGRMYS